MQINFDDILTEWSYRLPKGFPTIVDGKFVVRDEVVILNEILEGKGLESIELPEAVDNVIIREELQGTNTPDFKEGLVVYFTALPSKTLAEVEAMLQAGSGKLVLPAIKNEQFYGTKSVGYVKAAIDHLSKGLLVKKEAGFFYNALSVAKLIQSIYGKPVQADRGVVFEQIRGKALELANSLGGEMSLAAADKWCPADIYIYNDKSAAKMALAAKSLNVDDKSLNAQFQSNYKNTTEGILGISLKEEKAQAGKASSFKGILTKEANYPEAPALPPTIKAMLEVSYNLGQSLTVKDKKLGIGYFAEARKVLDKITPKDAPSVESLKSELEKVLVNTLGKKNIQATLNKKGLFDKDRTRKVFGELGLTDIKLTPGYTAAVQKFYGEIKKKCEAQYKQARASFTNTLQSLNYNVPSQAPDVAKMSPETLLKKTNCYITAEYLLNGLNANSLKIPQGYQSLMTQKNAFVALTAYAIGMAGISPTFVKMIGSSKGAPAHVDTFYGSGFLNLDDEVVVNVVDTTEYKGFYVTFTTKVTLKATKAAKPVKRYKVTLDFRYAGDQLNIEVSELKEA